MWSRRGLRAALAALVLAAAQGVLVGWSEVDPATGAPLGAPQPLVSRTSYIPGTSESAAILYLLGPSFIDWEDWVNSLATIEEHAPAALADYDVVVLHEDLPLGVSTMLHHQVRAKVPSMLPRLRFVNIELAPPPHLPRNVSCPFQKALRPPQGYCNMCYLFFSRLFDMPQLARYRYLMRLDTDSFFRSPVTTDPFKAMHDNDWVYGYKLVTADNVTYTKGLWRFTWEYMLAEGELARAPADPNLQPGARWMPADVDDPTALVYMFYNNFEVLDMQFWRNHPGIRKWIRHVDASGHIYASRWGDAPLRWLAVTMYIPWSRAHWFSPEEFLYQHYKWTG